MLRKLIESRVGPMFKAQFAEVLDLATTDIKGNRISFNKQTSLSDVVEIARRCFAAMGRGNVA